MQAILKSWAKSSRDEFDSVAARCSDGTHRWARADAAYYQATLMRGNTPLEAVVEVTPEYPQRPPRFVLALPKGFPDGKAGAPSVTEVMRATSDPGALEEAAATSASFATNDLKAMENGVNAFVLDTGAGTGAEMDASSDASGGCLLACQVRHLQAAFDAFVDSRKEGLPSPLTARGKDRRKV